VLPAYWIPVHQASLQVLASQFLVQTSTEHRQGGQGIAERRSRQLLCVARVQVCPFPPNGEHRVNPLESLKTTTARWTCPRPNDRPILQGFPTCTEAKAAGGGLCKMLGQAAPSLCERLTIPYVVASARSCAFSGGPGVEYSRQADVGMPFVRHGACMRCLGARMLPHGSVHDGIRGR